MRSPVLVISVRENGRSRKLAPAIASGVNNAGDRSITLDSKRYLGRRRDCSAIAFYGYQDGTPEIMSDALSRGTTVVFLDLGYWGRRTGGQFTGFHKVAVNARHPTAYIEKLYGFHMPRPQKMVPRVQSWRGGGRKIVVCGMSDRAAASLGLAGGEWETLMIRRLRSFTDRPIVYRPKPSWKGAQPIPGAEFHTSHNIADALDDVHMVVSRHSNACVDALIRGIPVYCEEGAAYPMAIHDIKDVEKPFRPDNREEWISAVSWCQFTVSEISSGFAWRALKEQGMIQ